MQKEYSTFRSNFLTFWILSNLGVAVLFEYAQQPHHSSGHGAESVGTQLIIAYFGTSYLAYRLIFAITLTLRDKIMHSCIKKYQVKSIPELEALAKKEGRLPKRQPLRAADEDQSPLLSQSNLSDKRAPISASLKESDSDCSATLHDNEDMVQHGQSAFLPGQSVKRKNAQKSKAE